MRWACEDGKQGVNFLGRMCCLAVSFACDTEHILAELCGVGQGRRPGQGGGGNTPYRKTGVKKLVQAAGAPNCALIKTLARARWGARAPRGPWWCTQPLLRVCRAPGKTEHGY